MAGHLSEQSQEITWPTRRVTRMLGGRACRVPRLLHQQKSLRMTSTSHPKARRTSLPSAPSAAPTEDSPDDSPSHPEATPSGCSSCAKKFNVSFHSIALIIASMPDEHD